MSGARGARVLPNAGVQVQHEPEGEHGAQMDGRRHLRQARQADWSVFINVFALSIERTCYQECFYNKDGKWYYAGVYKSFRLDDLCLQEWDCLSQEVRFMPSFRLRARSNSFAVLRNPDIASLNQGNAYSSEEHLAAEHLRGWPAVLRRRPQDRLHWSTMYRLQYYPLSQPPRARGVMHTDGQMACASRQFQHWTRAWG